MIESVIVLASALVVVSGSQIALVLSNRRRVRRLEAQILDWQELAQQWEKIAGDNMAVAKQWQAASESFEKTANNALAMVRTGQPQ